MTMMTMKLGDVGLFFSTHGLYPQGSSKLQTHLVLRAPRSLLG